MPLPRPLVLPRPFPMFFPCYSHCNKMGRRLTPAPFPRWNSSSTPPSPTPSPCTARKPTHARRPGVLPPAPTSNYRRDGRHAQRRPAWRHTRVLPAYGSGVTAVC
ncbi:hypothetical protein CALVIDRAFT_397646 [Calocera viscosa TUFC12733]|uniref:Uncharacterized protein n=1 Tax=Calocera viscosa (strain TUFC12733) TaxID=1330018 RepID=A0A167PR83_CALVF|nr:hypothetical protein CALVIDRAFT_397646 [Calocera viscosa TUFC12733]